MVFEDLSSRCGRAGLVGGFLLSVETEYRDGELGRRMHSAQLTVIVRGARSR